VDSVEMRAHAAQIINSNENDQRRREGVMGTASTLSRQQGFRVRRT
jgi:hypothetical protein